MKAGFVWVILLASAAIIGLYQLPKVVVKSGTKPAAEKPTETKPLVEETRHRSPLPAEQQQKIARLRQETSPEALQNLSTIYASASRPDSAAFFAEQLTTLQPTLANTLQTADRYYEAFTYAVDTEKAKSMGEKARKFYQKALSENPALLSAKVNMAMTYVSSEAPMQGIAMLREVLEEDPDFEPALLNLGLLSMRSNQFEKGIGRFERILKKNPKNYQAMFYLGICYAETGQKEKARSSLEAVGRVTTDPTVQAGVKEYLNKLN